MIASHPLQDFQDASLDFLAGGGELGADMRRKEWAATPLGDARRWPQSLRTSVSICLNSRMPVLVWWGRDLLMLYNDAYRQLIGAKHPAALGQPGRECWPEIWHVIGPMLEAVLSRGESTFSDNLMLPLERKGFPEECYFTFSYSPIRDEAGRVGGVFCSVVETTTQVLAARRTRTLRHLAEIAAVGRTEADALALAMDALREAAADVPWALYQELGDTGLESPVSVGLEKPEVEALSAVLGSCVERVRHTRIAEDLPSSEGGASGPRGWVLPIGKSGSGLSGLLVLGKSPMLAFDESYRTFFELVAAALASSLETARAFEDEKHRAEVLAQLDRAKTIFFNNISHEFRTPLTLLLGPVDELRRSAGLPDGADEQLGLIRRNALRLQRLVNALLEFSRLEAGRAHAVFRPTDLSRHTRDLAGSFRAAFERAGVELEVNAPDLGRPVYVDREMWERIVLNLLSNALKFTFEGKVTVRQQVEGSEAVLTIRDTGTGIAEHELPRLFERFYRVVGARARTHEGSGIGLALVSDLVRLHGGQIQARSRFGEGSEFEVRIPLGFAHLEAERVDHEEARPRLHQVEAYLEEAMRWLPEAAQADAAAPTRSPAELPRIVLADDNADMREYLIRLLEGRFQIEAFRTGTEALAAIRRHCPDLVLTDVMMPELDGFGLVAAIRADSELQDTPVLMLSARAGEEARSEGLEAGADDYLVKPFSPRELLARLDAHLARRALRRLERQHARQLAAVFENAPVAIAMLRGPELIYDFANPSYRALVGGRDVVGKPLLSALPELQGQGVFELLQGVLRAGKPFTHQALRVDLQRHAGAGLEEVFFNLVYEPLKDDQGQVHAIAVVATDVTELARARQAAEEANQAKDEFMAMLGHELRNPLAPMLTTLELMRLQAPEVLDRERGILERQVQHLARLVDDLLDVSRIVQGKIELKRETVELSTVTATAVEQVSPLLEERGHYLRVSVPRSGLRVSADPGRLSQVLFNLLHNAAKYTDPGGHIVVVAHREGSEVAVSVRDDGVGISPELQPRVFETFFQARQDRDRAKGGLGLGLALVKSLSELHGGRVAVESPGVGKGSTFTVRLPLAPEHTAANGAPGAEAASRGAPDRGLHILVVDDNVDAAESIAEVLELLGNKVQVAHDGLEALRLARESEPDLALLDIGLPVIDGYELAQRLRSEHPALRLVAVSGYGQDRDRAAAIRAGFSRHLVKPVSLQEIESVVTAAEARPAR